MKNKNDLILSTLGHTWILDLDGTVVKHNGYKEEGKDTILDGVLDFFRSIPDKDMIIFITSRSEDVKQMTEKFLTSNGIRFDHIIYGAPFGERILFNDNKPSGLKMGYCINTERDHWCDCIFKEDMSL